MKRETTVSVNGGIGFVGLLTITLIAFKLMRVVNWSWLWVLSPMWFTIAINLLIILVPLIFCGILHIARKIRRRAKQKRRFKNK